MPEPKRSIHTRIARSTYDKLKNTYGGGVLCDGIEKVVDLAEQKTMAVKEGVRKVVDRILAEK